MNDLLLVLARHGQTQDNVRGIFQGQAGRGLDALGRVQAERLAERVRLWPPAAIVSSDLERAVETAQIASAACGVPVEVEPGLREVDVGAWSNRGRDEVRQLFPEEWAAWERGLDPRRGGGETYAELAARMDEAIARIAARHAAARGRVLVVSHGAAIKSWVRTLLGLPAAGRGALGGMSNCGLTVVTRDGSSRHRVLSWNDAAHLEGLDARTGAD